MSGHCIAKWFLVVLAVGSLRTTNSIEEIDCTKLNKNCLLVTECVSAIDLLKARKYNALREMFCGFDTRGPKVCCPIDIPIVFTNNTTTVATTTEKINEYGLPSKHVCGLNSPSSDRIVGGNIASIEEFPWLARIRVIGAGEWDSETTTDCQNGVCSDPPVDLNVTKVTVHESYNKRTLVNDIALLLLEKAVNYTDFVRPVCLPLTPFTISQDYVTGTLFVAAGWGLTENGSTSVVKRKVTLDTVPMDECRSRLPTYLTVEKVNKIICAGGEIGRDTCNGDSGGPLVKEITEGSDVNWYLYGITSFGTRKCGVTDKPAGYTRVTSYLDWIKDHIAS